jgi:hypothetical protein
MSKEIFTRFLGQSEKKVILPNTALAMRAYRNSILRGNKNMSFMKYEGAHLANSLFWSKKFL